VQKKKYVLSLKTAQKMFKTASDLYGEESKNLSVYHTLVGNSYFLLKKYPNALQNFENSYKINSNHLIKNEMFYARDFLNIGKTLYKLEQFDKAIFYLQKSLDIRIRKLGDAHSSVAILYDMIGSIYEEKGENDKALDYYQKSLSVELKALQSIH